MTYLDYVEDFYWNLMWTPILIWSDFFMESLTLSNSGADIGEINEY